MSQSKLAQHAAFVRSQSSRSRAAYLYREILATRDASRERKAIPFGRSCQRKCVIVDRSKNRLRSGIVLRNGNFSSHFLTFGFVCSAVDKPIIAPVDRPVFQYHQTGYSDPSARAKLHSIYAVLHTVQNIAIFRPAWRANPSTTSGGTIRRKKSYQLCDTELSCLGIAPSGSKLNLIPQRRQTRVGLDQVCL